MNDYIHQPFSSFEELEKETLEFLQEMYRGRFPQWMWCNSVIIEMLVYLRDWNKNTKDLKQKGFKFIGTTICYAFMQATGLINDHVKTCFRYNEIKNLE